jgi:hypothetical protein
MKSQKLTDSDANKIFEETWAKPALRDRPYATTVESSQNRANGPM